MNLDPLGFAKDFALVCLVFIPLERFFSLRKEQKRLRRGLATDLAHVGITRIFIIIGEAALFALTVSFLRELVPESVRQAVVAQPLWLSCIEVVVIADIGFYAVHRAFHYFSWLWQFHAVHHSIEEMDFIAAHRVHPVDQILTRGATLLPIFALGFPREALLFFTVFYHWQSLLIHSNVRIKFGPLRKIFASPEFHHWHHADQPEALNKNFAGQLSLLDVLFGTLHMPRGEMPRKYGLPEPLPHSYWRQIIYPFSRIYKSIKNSIFNCQKWN